MILYFAPGACSLADHIALHEANLEFDRVKVDLRSHTTEDGRDFTAINPKGYVPALTLDGGELLTENLAILAWVADKAPALAPKGELGRYRLLETLAFISTEVHKSFKPFFTPSATDAEKQKAGETITKKLKLLAEKVDGGYLFGPDVSVADAYLYVMLMWARKTKVEIPHPLLGFFDRMNERVAVKLALQHEGLA